MSLKSIAQELIVVDPSSDQEMSLVPVEMPQGIEVGEDNMEVYPASLEIVLTDLPGAPPGTKAPEPIIEVSEEDEKEDSDDNHVEINKTDKWNWSQHGGNGFFAWVKERVENPPSHSGYDTAGLERCISYYDKLDVEISKAMRSDVNGDLDANQVEKARHAIEQASSLLQDRLDKIKAFKKSNRKKKAEDDSDFLVKEGQKITGVSGVVVTVPLLISRIARVCINGMVSAGHDIEDLYERQVKFYKLDVREQAELMQLLSDMGYNVRQDRGFMPDKDFDQTSSDNMDWASNRDA